MKNTILARTCLAVLLCALALAACGPAPTPSAVEVTRVVEVTAPPRTIRIGYASEADLGDVPSLMALALLAEQGYAVLPINFSQSVFATEAVAVGDVNVATGSTNSFWAAVSKDAPIVTAMEQVTNLWQVYAVNSIQECADLDGKRFAISGESAVNAKMMNAYIAENCPGIEMQIVIIQGSQNRAAALLAGEIDATPVELADAIQLAHDAPGEFHTLTNFGQDLPNLRTTAYHFNRAYAEQNPQAVRDFIRAVLTVHRQINADHERLVAEAARRLDLDPETMHDISEAYFSINAWDANGGLTQANVQYTLEFFQNTSDLDANLTLGDVADLSYLESVLAEMGQ